MLVKGEGVVIGVVGVFVLIECGVGLLYLAHLYLGPLIPGLAC